MTDQAEPARNVTDLIGIVRAMTGQNDEQALNLLIAACVTHAQATGQADDALRKVMWGLAAVRPQKGAQA